MLRRLLTVLAGFALSASPALAGPQKPLTLQGGQFKQLQAGDTITLNAATTASASINVPHGTAPNTPADGDVWTTSSGEFVRINGVTTSWAPHAANRNALANIPSSLGRVVREGYAAAGDAPPVTYVASNSACSLNAGAGDGGWQVPTADNKCWIANFTGGADIREWGAASAASDNSAAFLAAVNAAANGVGQGRVVIPPSYFKVAQSANLDLTGYKNVSIACIGGSVGVQTASNLTAPCTLQLNPAYSILLGANQELAGLRVVNMNIENAASTRQAITNAQNFTGTGIVANYNDVSIHDVTINGFSQAFITTNAQRIKLDNVVGDDTNFVNATLCNDTCQFTRLEAWPFTVNGQIPQHYSVTGVSNSGGKFQIAYNNAMGTPLLTGDIVVLDGLGGTGQPLGRYTITAVDSSHFTLNGSTYSSGYTSGGFVELSSTRRVGAAFYFAGANTGGEGLSSLWEYGHDTCLFVGPQHGPDDVHYLWCDGDDGGGSLADNGSTGVSYQGYGAGVFGGAILNKTVSVYVNSTDSLLRPFTINGVSSLATSGCLASANANAGAAVTIVQGTVLMTGTNLSGANLCTAGYNAFNFGSAANALKISSSQLGGFGFYFATPSMCGQVTIDGVSRGCTPASSSATCTVGQISWDTTYEYVCTAPNTWKRSALSTF